MPEDLAAEVAAKEAVEGLFTDLPDEPDDISEYTEQRARLERQRTLTDARAAVSMLTAAYADASGTTGAPLDILTRFDQWVASYGAALAALADDEYDDAHRNPEGGH
jgi:hypothetical protein